MNILELLRNEITDTEYISPNYIADFAYNHGIKLSSEEVVFIFDNIDKIIG